MLVVFTVKDRIKLLPYFFQYYRKMGATRFVCCLADGFDNPLFEEIESWKSVVDLEIRATISTDPAVWCGPSEQGAVEVIRRNLSEPWHIMADLDEFYWLPPGMSLLDMLDKLTAGGYVASTCHLLDRIAEDGSLADPGQILDTTYPTACDITAKVGGCIDKVALVRTDIPLHSGHHSVDSYAPTLAWGEFHHFKWLPGVLNFLVERSRNFERLGLSWFAEGFKTAELFQNGKLDLTKVTTSRAPVIEI
jgi:hypothetical protein